MGVECDRMQGCPAAVLAGHRCTRGRGSMLGAAPFLKARGLSWQNFSANFSMMRSIFCASPGSLRVRRRGRQLSERDAHITQSVGASRAEKTQQCNWPATLQRKKKTALPWARPTRWAAGVAAGESAASRSGCRPVGHDAGQLPRALPLRPASSGPSAHKPEVGQQPAQRLVYGQTTKLLVIDVAVHDLAAWRRAGQGNVDRHLKESTYWPSGKSPMLH